MKTEFIDGVEYQPVECGVCDSACALCIFDNGDACEIASGSKFVPDNCLPHHRTDNKDVYYIDIEESDCE